MTNDSWQTPEEQREEAAMVERQLQRFWKRIREERVRRWLVAMVTALAVVVVALVAVIAVQRRHFLQPREVYWVPLYAAEIPMRGAADNVPYIPVRTDRDSIVFTMSTPWPSTEPQRMELELLDETDAQHPRVVWSRHSMHAQLLGGDFVAAVVARSFLSKWRYRFVLHDPGARWDRKTYSYKFEMVDERVTHS